MTLYDQFEQPITASEIRKLREEVAIPTLAGVRPAIAWHPADGLTPARLAQLHSEAAQGYGRRYLELAEDIEERDLHYAAVLRTRKLAVSQLPMTVEPAGDDKASLEHAAFMQEWLDKGILDDVLFDILDGVGKAFSVHEIVWHVGADGTWPERLIFRPQRWFDPARGDLDTLMLREAATLVPLQPHKFLIHRHPSKSGVLLRTGLARLASWAWMWKAFTVRDWATFVQNYGQPMRLGRYDRNASDAERLVLWTAVSNIAGDCAAIVPKGMDVQFIEVGDVSKGSEVYEKRADWLNREMSKAVLGQTSTTDAAPGSHAIGSTHRLVQDDIERADARMLGTTVTRQIAQPMVAFTFGPQKKYPKVRFGRPDEAPLEQVIAAADKLVPLGFRMEQGPIRARLGFKEPDAKAELLVPPRAAPVPAPVAEDPTLPPPKPGERPRGTALNAARTRAAAQLATPDVVDHLTDRMALDAEGALTGLLAEIRAEMEAATDMADLGQRIALMQERHQLSPKQLAVVMGRGLALAELAGRAALMDELAPPAKR